MTDPSADSALEGRIRESREHGGEVVARFHEGAAWYAATYEELFDRLEREHVDLRNVLIDFILPADATMLYIN